MKRHDSPPLAHQSLSCWVPLWGSQVRGVKQEPDESWNREELVRHSALDRRA